MPLPAGTRLGPYEIIAPLGAGGMGEVYRARDTRLGREVAIKTLPAGFARDPERLARFETETKAVAALSHPSLLAIHDIGTEDGITFAVTELIEGRTLRERLADGPLSAPRAVALAVQVAQGLAAAHDRGVIHRDLKPENVMVTADGRAKILDFGLAKRESPEAAGSQSLAPTVAAMTEPGAVLGTTNYMSPEQVRGQVVDARSDIFSFGVLLYELLSGRQPFRGESPADTMTAILREDPVALTQLIPELSPGLERIVQRCLEKQPAARFRSAADLAFALEAVATSGSSDSHAKGAGADPAPTPRLAFRRLTFRNGHVASARFTPDGAGVVYGAAWDGRPHEIYTSRTGSPESRSLGLPAGNLLSMSATGEMAVSLGYRHFNWFQVSGTLARVALAGGGVRPLQKDVGSADWSPDGRTLALVRYRDGRCVLEYPAGRVVVETTDWLGQVRVSPDGRKVAFGRHHRTGEGEADLCVADADGTLHLLASDLTNLSGLAWSPSGDEVWFSGINLEQRNGLWSATLDGRVRDVHISATRITLHDVRHDGKVLVTLDELRTGLSVGTAAAAPETDLSWFDGSVATSLSADGEWLLFAEVAEAENPHYACYLRNVDGTAAVRLGEGLGSHLAADGKWALALMHQQRRALMLYPSGLGETREVPLAGIERALWAGFHPDGMHAFVVGATAEDARALYLAPLSGGEARRVWDEDMAFDRFVGLPIAPDGERLVLRRTSGEHVLHAWRTQVTAPIRGLTAQDIVLGFDDSGDTLYLTGSAGLDRSILRFDLATGTRTPWRTPALTDPRGVAYVAPPVVAANGSRFAYSYLRLISNLYLVEGLER